MAAHAAFWGALAPHCYDDPSCISNTPAPVAQGIEHGSPKAGVGSSNLLWGTNLYPSDLHQRGRFSTLLLIDPAYQNTKVVKIGFDTV